MSEANFFPTSAGQYRGSKFPAFAGGAADQSGNVQNVGASANVSQATGNNATPAQTQQQQVSSGNTSAQTGTLGTDAANNVPKSALASQSIPSGPSTTLGGEVAQAVLPGAGQIAGTAIGNSISAGSSLGGALDSGGEALLGKATDLFSGNFSSLLGVGGGSSAAAGSTAGSTLSSAGAVDGLQATNVGVSGVDSLGTNAVSDGVGADAAGSAADSGLGSLAGAGLAGVGTFVAGLLSGQDPAQAAISGVGAFAGAELGTLILPGIGTIVGGFLGSMLGGLFGNSHPTVGPNGFTAFGVDPSGQLNVGKSGVDNGANPQNTIDVANSSTAAINKILNDNNLSIDPSKLPSNANDPNGVYGTLAIYQGDDARVHGGQTMPHSALDIWNYLLSNNAITSRTPNSEQPTSNTQTSSGNNAPVLRLPGSVS